MDAIIKYRKALTIGGLVAFAAGIAGWLGIINSGPDIIELTESAQWGLLVGMFFFLEALGSGCLMIGGLTRNPKAALLGVASVIGACVVILMDLYHPAAAWRLFFAPNMGSPMFLDVLFSALCIILGSALVLTIRKGCQKWVAPLSVAVVVLSVLFPLGTAWLCTTLPGQWGWSALELISFFLAVGVCAGSCAVVCGMKQGRAILLAALAATFVFAIADAGFLIYGTTTATDTLTNREVVMGVYAPLFWVTNLGFVVVPAILLLVTKIDARIAAVLAVAGTALGKYLFAVKGNLFPYITIPDVHVQLIGSVNGMPISSYFPSGFEWLAFIGAVGLVIAIVSFVLPKISDQAE